MDHLTQCPIAEEEEIEVEFLDEDIIKLVEEKWKMYFDGAANRRGCKMGIFLVSPEESHTPFAIKLNFLATNNIVEYIAYILELEATYKLGIEDLEVYGNSALIIAKYKGNGRSKKKSCSCVMNT